MNNTVFDIPDLDNEGTHDPIDSDTKSARASMTPLLATIGVVITVSLICWRMGEALQHGYSPSLVSYSIGDAFSLLPLTLLSCSCILIVSPFFLIPHPAFSNRGMGVLFICCLFAAYLAPSLA